MDDKGFPAPPTPAEEVVLAALATAEPAGLDLCGLHAAAVRDPRMTGVERFAEAVADALHRCIASGAVIVERRGERGEPRYLLASWGQALPRSA